ncbi:MAG: DUF5050 domain-containing protein [Ruminococcus sp.]|nr:DUF5050 domain-containing protein [Ruminococcus sp.]
MNETDGTLGRVRTNGTSYTDLFHGSVHEVTVSGAWVYFATADALYRMCLDQKTNAEQINSNYTRWLNTDVTYLYYTNLEDHTEAGVGYGNSLYRMELDGSVNERIFQDDVEGICIQGDVLYYMNPDRIMSLLSLS